MRTAEKFRLGLILKVQRFSAFDVYSDIPTGYGLAVKRCVFGKGRHAQDKGKRGILAALYFVAEPVFEGVVGIKRDMYLLAAHTCV